MASTLLFLLIPPILDRNEGFMSKGCKSLKTSTLINISLRCHLQCRFTVSWTWLTTIPIFNREVLLFFLFLGGGSSVGYGIWLIARAVLNTNLSQQQSPWMVMKAAVPRTGLWWQCALWPLTKLKSDAVTSITSRDTGWSAQLHYAFIVSALRQSSQTDGLKPVVSTFSMPLSFNSSSCFCSVQELGWLSTTEQRDKLTDVLHRGHLSPWLPTGGKALSVMKMCMAWDRPEAGLLGWDWAWAVLWPWCDGPLSVIL